MSQLRQTGILTEYDPRRGVSIASLAYEYPSKYEVPEHAHGSDQLIYASKGLMEVSAGQSRWLIPPHFAIWIPARTSHRIRMPGAASMRTLYLEAKLVSRAEPGAAVLHVTPLLRELILEAVRMGRLRARRRSECALRDLLIVQLEKATSIPATVTLPQEKRALALSQTVLKNPAERQTMAALCTRIGVSPRTMERTFQKEAGISFEAWRQQARLMKAIELMVTGDSVKEAAFKIGYSQPSAFVAVFRRTFGTTPKVWISALRPVE